MKNRQKGQNEKDDVYKEKDIKIEKGLEKESDNRQKKQQKIKVNIETWRREKNLIGIREINTQTEK